MLQKKLNRNTKGGFTLIELMVVISIIALLSSIILASLTRAASLARDVQRRSDLQQIATALELFYQTNGAYPTSTIDQATGVQAPPAAVFSGLSVGNWNWDWLGGIGSRFLPPSDMPVMPVDPQNFDHGDACNPGSPSRLYSYYSDGQNYILAAHLETPPDPKDTHYYNGTSAPGCNGYANWAIENGYH